MGCSWFCMSRQGETGTGRQGSGRDGWAPGTGEAGRRWESDMATVGVRQLPGEELGAETQWSTGWSPLACRVELNLGCGQEWCGQFPGQGHRWAGLLHSSPHGQVHQAGASGAAESARAGAAAAAADDLQICSGSIPAGFPCVPGAALLPPSQARQPCGLGMAAASASLCHPHPPSPA